MKLHRTSAAPKDWGFGPPTQITGRQVATIVLVAMFVSLLIPLGASAAGGLSKVLITDPTNTTQQAHVDATGNLQVGGTVNVGNSPTVNVGNTPTVTAQQSGSWNVGITGTPMVGIDPGANTVNDVNDPARQVVRAGTSMVIADGQDSNSSTVYTVPANKRLVVTDASFSVTLPTGQQLLSFGLQSAPSLQFFAPLLLGSNGAFDVYQTNSQTTFVVDAGDNLRLFLTRNSTSGTAFAGVAVTGYLIDCTAQLPCN
jgi:hypothetical protein